MYCNTSWDEAGTYHKNPRAPGSKHFLKFSLVPWNNYTFHVRAENALGMSERSEFTPFGACTTGPLIPARNPDGVCTESRTPGQLVIVWEVSGWEKKELKNEKRLWGPYVEWSMVVSGILLEIRVCWCDMVYRSSEGFVTE